VPTINQAETREANAAELRAFVRFRDQVIKQRAIVERAIVAGGLCSQLQQAIKKYDVRGADGYQYGYAPGMAPVWSAADLDRIELITARANKLEQYLSGLELRALYMRPGPGEDFTILRPVFGKEPEGYPYQQWAGLGLVPLIIVVAGVVLVASAIAVAIGLEASATKAELEYRSRLVDADRWAAAQGGKAAELWSRFKRETAAANPAAKSFWERFTKGIGEIGSALPYIGIGLLALWLLSKLASSRPAPAERSEAA